MQDKPYFNKIELALFEMTVFASFFFSWFFDVNYYVPLESHHFL